MTEIYKLWFTLYSLSLPLPLSHSLYLSPSLTFLFLANLFKQNRIISLRLPIESESGCNESHEYRH